jgi:hypothetical protein
MKKVDFKVLSDHVCNVEGCSVHIKKNLVARRPAQKSFMCFNHFMARVKKNWMPKYDRYRDKSVQENRGESTVN